MQMKRPEVQSAHTEWKVGQVAQELGRMWKALTEDEKKVYEKMAYDDKHRYEAEMKDYKAGRKPGSSTPQQQQQQQQPGTAMQQQQPQMQQMHMQQQVMSVQQMQQGKNKTFDDQINRTACRHANANAWPKSGGYHAGGATGTGAAATATTAAANASNADATNECRSVECNVARLL